MPTRRGHPDDMSEGQMRFDAYANIKGISGECTDLKHKEWIEILSMRWGVSQPSGTGGGGTIHERADFDDFTFCKLFEKSSPILYSYCARGSEISEIRIELCQATGTHHCFGVIKLKKAIISRVQLLSTATQWSAPRPIEEVSCRYRMVEWEYTSLDHAGKPGGMVRSGWDLGANTAL